MRKVSSLSLPAAYLPEYEHEQAQEEVPIFKRWWSIILTLDAQSNMRNPLLLPNSIDELRNGLVRSIKDAFERVTTLIARHNPSSPLFY
jgi:hypothetical protein